MSDSLFYFGFALLLTPVVVMWLDGYLGKGSGDDNFYRWMMSKNVPQWFAMSAMMHFGLFAMMLLRFWPR